jgi:hypothetical protein
VGSEPWVVVSWFFFFLFFFPDGCSFLYFKNIKNRCDSRMMFGLGGMPHNI